MLDVNHWDSKGLTLAVECINLIVVGIVKALLGEVLLVALHFDDFVACDLLGLYVVEEMVVIERGIVEQVHEQQLVGDEAAVDEWVWKVVDWHRMVVQTKRFINI